MARHDDDAYRNLVTLIGMIEHAIHAWQDAQQFATGAELAADRVHFNSAAMEITQVQESARRLSDEFHETNPQLPWKMLRDMRNILIHGYDAIDEEALYETVTSDAPELALTLQPLIEQIAQDMDVSLGEQWNDLIEALSPFRTPRSTESV